MVAEWAPIKSEELPWTNLYINSQQYSFIIFDEIFTVATIIKPKDRFRLTDRKK